MAKPPQKWEKKPGRTNWTVSPEWKQWKAEQNLLNDLKEAKETKSKSKKNKLTLNAENHKTIWKPAAKLHDEKTVYFCVCRSSQGDPFRGCGAVGVQIRNGAIMQMNASKFEGEESA